MKKELLLVHHSFDLLMVLLTCVWIQGCRGANSALQRSLVVLAFSTGM